MRLVDRDTVGERHFVAEQWALVEKADELGAILQHHFEQDWNECQ